MKIKIVQNKEIRVWKYPKKNKYKTLLKFIAKTFGLTDTKSYSLQYLDDEGDSINIRNDNDIDDALLFAKEERRKSLKIFLISSIAMDSFLDDALSDFFSVISTPSITPNKMIKNISQTTNIALKPKKSSQNGMNPEDILASMFDEETIENTVNVQKEKSKSRLPKVENKMSPDDILNSMVMDMNDLNFSPQKSRQNHINLDNNSPPKPIQNGHHKSESDHDLLQTLLNEPLDVPQRVVKSDDDNLLQNLLNIEPSKVISNKPSLPMKEEEQTESDDLLKQLLTENERNEVKQMNAPIIDHHSNNESDDLLEELLNDSDDANLPKLPSMDAQSIINSIVNPQKSQEPIASNEDVHLKEESLSDLKLNEAEETDVAQIPYTQHMQPPKALIPLQPTIQSKVPPAPFLQPNHSRSPVGENANGYVQNRVDFAGSDSHKLALLAQFNALKVPQHDPHKKEEGVRKIGDDGDEEEEKEPDADTLDEIRQSIDNPMSIHDVNMAQIQTDLKREKLLEPVMENDDEQIGIVNNENDDDGVQDMIVPGVENEKIENLHDDNLPNENVDQIKVIANDEESTNTVIDDAGDENVSEEDGIEQNAEPSESDPVIVDVVPLNENENKDNNENEIDALYAELDGIDMDFEINKLENKANIVVKQEEENLKINIDESNNEIVDDLQISPMEDSNQSKNEDEEFPNTHAENEGDDPIDFENKGVEIEVEEEKIEDDDHSESVIPPSNDLISDEIFIGIDPANFNQSEDEQEEEEDDDDKSMDLTQTTPDPIPIKKDEQNDSNLKHPECDVNEHSDDMDIEQTDELAQKQDNTQNTQQPKVERNKDTNNINQESNKEEIVQNVDEVKLDKESILSTPKSVKVAVSPNIISADISPRDQRRLTNKLLREEQREKDRQQKLIEKQQRMEERKKIKEIQKQQKDEEKLKRLQQKQLINKSKKYEKNRRIRQKELEKLKEISEGEIFTTNKNWYPIKFVLNTQKLAFEFENYADLIQIIELQSTKQYRVHPSFVECVFNDDNIHCAQQHKLPSSHHCIVYIYYKWRTVQIVNYQSVNLLLSDSEEYIPKVNVFRIPPWINTKSSQTQLQNDGDNMNNALMINPNEIYAKCLESEILKAKMSKRSSKSSPFSLFKLGKQRESETKKQSKPSMSVLLPENCEQTPNFRWKFDLTQDYSSFDPLLNDECLANAMHEYEIYFVQIRSKAVIGDLARIYDVFVIYLTRCDDGTECLESLLCNLPKIKKNEVYSPPYKNEIELFLLECVDDEQQIVDEILKYLKYQRCYGFVTIAKNTSVGIKDCVVEEIVFHYGSIGDWLKGAIVGKDDFDKDMKRLQKCGKWNNKQHISLIAFLNSIHSGTYTI